MCHSDCYGYGYSYSYSTRLQLQLLLLGYGYSYGCMATAAWLPDLDGAGRQSPTPPASECQRLSLNLPLVGLT